MNETRSREAAMARIIVDAAGAKLPLPAAAGAGAPMPRTDGPAKVSGRALYAGEQTPEGTLHCVTVPSPIARGRVVAVAREPAQSVPGVTHVLLAADMPRLGHFSSPPLGQSHIVMSDDRIHYEGQPLALILAETREAAEAASALARLDLDPEQPTPFEAAPAIVPRTADQGNPRAMFPISGSRGDFDAAYRAATHRLDESYDTPSRHHNMMEPTATFAEWRGGELHVHTASQWVFGAQAALAALFGLEANHIRVVSPFTGGGFGAKGFIWPHVYLAAAAAKIAGRPVKLISTREDCYTGNGYQPLVRSRIRLGADADGRLTALAHDAQNLSSRMDEYIEFAIAGSRSIYASDTAVLRTRIRQTDMGTPTPMRAPHEGPGMVALEAAMDELACLIGLDPLELRLRNHAETDPDTGQPFSSKKLREAYAEGARRIGWDRRASEPRARAEGSQLIGLGMASAIMATFRRNARARLRYRADGRLIIEVGAQEIGTGTRTIFAQIAAEQLGLAAECCEVELGSTALPNAGSTSGSSTTVSAGSAIVDAARELKAQLRALAGTNEDPPPERRAHLLRSAGRSELVADGMFRLPADAAFDAHGGASGHAMHSFGATFVEVAVDEALGTVRVRRAVGCYSAGRILNPLTARSQMIGGIVWGIGRALLEHSVIDPRFCRFVSKDLSGVHVPVNADIPCDVDVCFIDEHDPHASATGARGIGELGEVGVAAAITSAIYNATGRRIRNLPVRISDLVSRHLAKNCGQNDGRDEE